MARLSKIHCSKCGQIKDDWHNEVFPPRICSDCAGKAAKVKKEAHLDALTKLPIEERLRKLEEGYYDKKNHLS